MDNDQAALVRRGFAAFANQDMDTLQQLFADDAVWHASGNNILSGDYKGRDEIFGMFGRLLEGTQGSFQQEVHAVTQGDDHVVAITTATASRNGKTMNSNNVLVFHVAGDKVTEVWNTPFDQARMDDFWA